MGEGGKCQAVHGEADDQGGRGAGPRCLCWVLAWPYKREDLTSGEGWLGHWGATGVELAPGTLKTEGSRGESTGALRTAWLGGALWKGAAPGRLPCFPVSGPACPAGMEYKECVSPCARTCQSLHVQEVCRQPCVDGCSCPGNKLLTLLTNPRPCGCPWPGEARGRPLVFVPRGWNQKPFIYFLKKSLYRGIRIEPGFIFNFCFPVVLYLWKRVRLGNRRTVWALTATLFGEHVARSERHFCFLS